MIRRVWCAADKIWGMFECHLNNRLAEPFNSAEESQVASILAIVSNLKKQSTDEA
jgi:hypothetical protein